MPCIFLTHLWNISKAMLKVMIRGWAYIRLINYHIPHEAVIFVNIIICILYIILKNSICYEKIRLNLFHYPSLNYLFFLCLPNITFNKLTKIFIKLKPITVNNKVIVWYNSTLTIEYIHVIIIVNNIHIKIINIQVHEKHFFHWFHILIQKCQIIIRLKGKVICQLDLVLAYPP